MLSAVRNTGRGKGRRTPTQDPSTDLAHVVARSRRPAAGELSQELLSLLQKDQGELKYTEKLAAAMVERTQQSTVPPVLKTLLLATKLINEQSPSITLRQSLQQRGQAVIRLQDFECEPDPTHGDKPQNYVRPRPPLSTLLYG